MATQVRADLNVDAVLDPDDLFRHVLAEPSAALAPTASRAGRRTGRGRRGAVTATSSPADRGHRERGAESMTMAGALNRALADALADDPTVLVFGEDVGTLGGVFRVTDGLAARFGEQRVFDTPLAESGIVGTAIGWP